MPFADKFLWQQQAEVKPNTAQNVLRIAIIYPEILDILRRNNGMKKKCKSFKPSVYICTAYQTICIIFLDQQ